MPIVLAQDKAEAGRTCRDLPLRPLHDRVVLKRLEEPEEVRAGIVIPDTAKEKPQEAEVLAVGPGKLSDSGEQIPMSFEAGDRVLLGKYAGTEVRLGDDDLVIAREDEIFAIVETNSKSRGTKGKKNET